MEFTAAISAYNAVHATGKTAAEALVDLILGKATVTVDLHLYTASDLANAPVWASGIGWLDSCTGEKWTARTTRTVALEPARCAVTAPDEQHPTSRSASPMTTPT